LVFWAGLGWLLIRGTPLVLEWQEPVSENLHISYYLGYHNAYQIIWGLFIGAGLGISLYLITELIPDRYPTSALGRTKIMLLAHPLITWLQIRDGWAISADGGREDEWLRWRTRWEIKKNIAQKQKKF
jgi:dolichyldiphosphatase